MLEVLNLYAPAGGRVEVTGSNGQVDLAENKTYRGLQVVCGEAHVQIGAPAEVAFNVTVSPEAARELSVRIPLRRCRTAGRGGLVGDGACGGTVDM